MFITKWLMFCWPRCPISPGHFRKVCEKLAGEHLNIDYAYCSFANGKGTKAGVLAVVRRERPRQGPACARRESDVNSAEPTARQKAVLCGNWRVIWQIALR